MPRRSSTLAPLAEGRAAWVPRFRTLLLAAAALMFLANVREAVFAGAKLAVRLAARGVDTVTPDQLLQQIHEGQSISLLDARTETEYAVSHIPGARRIDPRDPDLQALDGAEAAPIVIYCSVGWRSARVARLLTARGFRSVRSLEGGLFEWANRRGPLVDDRGYATTVVHPYGFPAFLLLKRALRARGAPPPRNGTAT